MPDNSNPNGHFPNINAYKTIFLKPDNQSRVAQVDNNNAFAIVFKPIDTTLDEVRLLFNLKALGTDENPNATYPINYYMSICEVDQGTHLPLIDDIGIPTLSNQISFSTIKQSTSTSDKKTWLRFKSSAVFSSLTESLELNKYYAIVIKSDAPSNDNRFLNNGVIYAEVQHHYLDNNTILGSFSFNNGQWLSRTFNYNPISPCMLMYGGIVDDTSELDLGITSTSGISSSRGYETYITFKNLEGSAPATNLRFVPSIETNNPEKYETYLALGKWMRFDPGYLPYTKTDFDSSLYDASLQGTNIAPGETVLLCQRDRVYPCPKPYYTTRDSLFIQNNPETINGETDLNTYSSSQTTLFNDNDSKLMIQKKSTTNFKEFNIRNANKYKDINNRTIDFGDMSPIINKNIKRFSSTSPKSGFKIIEHNDSNNINIAANRTYPEQRNKRSADDPDNALFDKEDKAAFTNYYLDAIESGINIPLFLTNSSSRFIDYRLSINNNYLYSNRVFPIQSSDLSEDGNYLISPNNRIPYFVGNNSNFESSSVGGVIDSLGFCLHTGRFNQSFASGLMPETNDFEILSNTGLLDSNEYMSQSLSGESKSQGLLFVQHNNCSKLGSNKVNALIVQSISNSGIKTFGQCISTGTFTQCDSLSANTLDIVIPDYSFSNNEGSFLTSKPFFFIPRPFNNRLLGKGDFDCGFEITNISGNTITVDITGRTVEEFINIGSISESDIELKTSEIEKTFYIAFWGEDYSSNNSSHSPVFGDLITDPSYDGYNNIEDNVQNRLFVFETTDKALNDQEKTFYNEHNLKHILDIIDRSADNALMAFCTVQTSNDLNASSFTRDKDEFKESLTNFWIDINNNIIPSGSIPETDYITSIYEASRRCPEDSFHILLFGTDDATYSGTSTTNLNGMMTHSNGTIPAVTNNTDHGKLYKVSGGVIVPVNPSVELLYSYHYCKPIKIHNASNTASSISVFEKLAALTGKTKNIISTMNADPDIPDENNYDGVHSYTNSNANLMDLVASISSYDAISNDSIYIRPDLKEYSLIVPFTKKGHEDSLLECVNASKLSNIYNGTNNNFFDLLNNKLYEVFNHPYSIWSDRNITFNNATLKEENINNTYFIYNYENGPYNGDNANKNNKIAYTTLRFDNEDKTSSIAIDLSANIKYSTISFSYKINYPEDISIDINSKVNVKILKSNSISFNVNDDEFITLFDGIIDNSDKIQLNEINGNFNISSNITVLPDGFNLFVLDLEDQYNGSDSRYLKLIFEPTEDSNASEVSIGKLRTYKKGTRGIFSYGYGYGSNLFDFFDLFEVSGDQKGTLITPTSSIPSLPSYSYGYGAEIISSDFIIPSIFGNIEESENIVENIGVTFKNDGEYIVIDMGKEVPINSIEFDVNATNDPNSMLSIYYKSFNYENSDPSRNILSQVIINEKVDVDNFYHEKINYNIFARLIVFKASNSGQFNISNLKVKIGSMLEVYNSIYDNRKESRTLYALYDENINQAPLKRVAKISGKDSEKYLGIKLDSNNPIPVTQISFSFLPHPNDSQNSAYYFKLQKTTAHISPLGISPTDPSWEDVQAATTRASLYERLPSSSRSFFNLRSNSISLDGLYLISDDEIIVARAANNGLVNNGPYVLRFNTKEDIVVSILESYSDGNKAFIKVNTDLSEIGAVSNTEFYFERPTIITFPVTTATALQLVLDSDKTAIINSLKVYTNLIDGNSGAPIHPTLGEISWDMTISTN